MADSNEGAGAKSFGQVAFEAMVEVTCKQWNLDRNETLGWDVQPEDVRNSWEVTATALIAEYQRRIA